jgi:hypothetical protein
MKARRLFLLVFNEVVGDRIESLCGIVCSVQSIVGVGLIRDDEGLRQS